MKCKNVTYPWACEVMWISFVVLTVKHMYKMCHSLNGASFYPQNASLIHPFPYLNCWQCALWFMSSNGSIVLGNEIPFTSSCWGGGWNFIDGYLKTKTKNTMYMGRCCWLRVILFFVIPPLHVVKLHVSHRHVWSKNLWVIFAICTVAYKLRWIL